MKRVFLHLVILCCCNILISQNHINESEYAQYIQSLIGGKLEVSIKSGRIDLLTNTHAYEIERAPKWKDSIGQSIWYALNTNMKAGIILILENTSDYKYFIQLMTALEYANLKYKIDVYLFPNDFKQFIKGE